MLKEKVQIQKREILRAQRYEEKLIIEIYGYERDIEYRKTSHQGN
jgi:hypothetical protein